MFHALLTTRCRNGPAYTESLRAEYEQRLAAPPCRSRDSGAPFPGVRRLAAGRCRDRRHFSPGGITGCCLSPWLRFMALLVIHERIARKQALAARAVDFYRRGLDRLDGRWSGSGRNRAALSGPEPSLCRRISTYSVRDRSFNSSVVRVPRAGEATLASWLSQPAAEDDVRSRQAGVDELRPKLDLREDLFLLGEDVRSGLHADALRRWGAAPPVAIPAYAPHRYMGPECRYGNCAGRRTSCRCSL